MRPSGILGAFACASLCAACAVPEATLLECMNDGGPWAHWSADATHTYAPAGSKSVVDSVTHLIWETGVDEDTDHTDHTYDEAVAYCGGATIDPSIAGAFRLPHRIELASILDFARFAAGASGFDAPPFMGPADYYWTDTPSAVDSSRAWQVWAFDGTTSTQPTATTAGVRCVHDPIPPDVGPPPCHRTVAGETPGGIATVADTETGLTWRRDSIEVGTLDPGVCGAGWRVPTIQELLTIVDDTQSKPALDPQAFPAQSGGPYWSSTANSTPGFVYYVDFTDGGVSASSPPEMATVRCVQ